jgi:hypothetical protein
MAQIANVTVEDDHLDRLARSNPIPALAELIWNAFDADADKVVVEFYHNSLGRIERIIVQDDGTGIVASEALELFKKLGGSWKKLHRRTKKNQRLHHGQEGQGRFKAYSIGGYVEWDTVSAENGKKVSYKITGRTDSKKSFEISDPKESKAKTGTRVTLDNLVRNFKVFEDENAIQQIKEIFALYLWTYPSTSIQYNNDTLSKANLDIAITTEELDAILLDDEKHEVELDIIEWPNSTKRMLYLCDSEGFTLEEIPIGVRTPGFDFTAHLKSDYFRQLHEQNFLDVAEMRPEVSKAIEAAKNLVRVHYKEKLKNKGPRVIQEWKEKRIYPYDVTEENPVEKAERETFDIIALNVNEFVPDFESQGVASKKLFLRLLRQVIEDDTEALQEILENLVSLPSEKKEELAELLKRTSLNAIINASKEVADRLEFIHGVRSLVFDHKKVTKERTQLHRLLAMNAWFFGEGFNISADDESLTKVLQKHKELLGDDIVIDEEVKTIEGKRGIVDLMLSQLIPQSRENQREHLVVELKRPSVTINSKEITQIKNYALRVEKDEEFGGVDVTWNFWLIGNELDDFAEEERSQQNRPKGVIHQGKKVTVWLKEWGEIFEENERRLKFYRDRLEYNATRATGLDFLKDTYKDYVPEEINS